MNRFKHIKYAVSLCLVLICAAIPLKASAFSYSDIENKTEEELLEDGWETREINASKSTVKCGLWSILASTVWRGYGHHCIGDETSHYRLLAMEGASIAMLATSLIMGSLTKDDKALSSTWKSLFHFGTTLFISSYIFDVFGTFKGDKFNLAENHLDPYGNSVNLSLRWLPSDDIDLGLELTYTYRTPRFWVSPYGYLDVSGISNYAIGVDTGVALWYGEKTHSYVAIALDGQFDDHLKNDYNSIRLIPYIEFSLDLGTWFPHLAEFRFVNRLGIGVNLFNFEYAPTKPFTDYDTLLVLETGLNLNLVKDVNFGVIYRYRPDYSVGTISAPSRLFQTVPVPGVGIFTLDLDFNISSGWRANLEANFGKSIDFWLGVTKHFE